MSPDAITGALQILGVTGLLALAILAIYKRWVVMGWQYLSLEKERDEWKQMALEGLKTTADVASAAKQHTILTTEEADAALRIIREAIKQ